MQGARRRLIPDTGQHFMWPGYRWLYSRAARIQIGGRELKQTHHGNKTNASAHRTPARLFKQISKGQVGQGLYRFYGKPGAGGVIDTVTDTARPIPTPARHHGRSISAPLVKTSGAGLHQRRSLVKLVRFQRSSLEFSHGPAANPSPYWTDTVGILSNLLGQPAPAAPATQSSNDHGRDATNPLR